jgi:mono/diheme cytochrome c family protein
MEEEYRAKGVQFMAVNVGADDTIVEIAAQAVEAGAAFPFVKDVDGSCAAALGVGSMPEAVVLDKDRTIRYRGRIDDQYRPGGQRGAPTRHDLKEAIDAVLAGKEVAVATTPVDGCRIVPKVTRADPTPVTYAEHVAPLLSQRCAHCHKPNGMGPFALNTYEQVRKRATTIVEVVGDGRMPPWYGAPGHDRFENEARLTPSERDLVARWVRGGMARGDESKAPPPPARGSEEGWRIEPDLVLTSPLQEIPAEGDVPYRYLLYTHPFLHETWVTQIQILPDNPRVVHHANLAFAALGQKFSASNFITGVVPGNDPMRLPKGVAFRIPPASMLVLQTHFVTTGKPEKCRIRIGLKFASGEVKQQLRHILFVDRRFAIPPHAPSHAVKATATLDRDVIGLGMFCHMHLRGKAMTFRAQPPEGDARTLLMIPNYNFEWQLPYIYPYGAQRFVKGTKLDCVALYDNSAFNPFNPNPDATVRDGPQTRHEMMNGFFFFVNADEDLKLDVDGKTGRARAK